MASPDTIWSKVQIYVEDPLLGDPPQRTLTGEQIKLEWDETVIKVYTDEARTPGSEISSGYAWTITDPFAPISVYVEAQQAGSTELLLSLVDPLIGRPLSDLIVVNVNQ